MTDKELERIEAAYHSGLNIQIIYSCGRWERFYARNYPNGGFSKSRQYRIVGDKYVQEAEKQITELNERLNKATEIIEELIDNFDAFPADYGVLDTASEFLREIGK